MRAYQQSITAGTDFDGTAPPGEPTSVAEVLKWEPAATGGLFDLEIDRPSELIQLYLVLGGDQGSWLVELIDDEGTPITLFAGTNEAFFVTQSADRIVLTKGQKIRVTTSGSDLDMKARVAIRDLD